ncbi:MAG: glycosyltrehalose trehalohydrolase [Flavobacteriaceae bacterium CG_4_9_14_0_8_um_filter_34_30]|nr:MAG: glycosyltrehalose trehalohydrolase [Flavobacteriaceae bacterium CG_4_9_14_0_8_um_filter_34_30]
MKKMALLICLVLSTFTYSQQQTGLFTTNPQFFNPTQQVTLTVSGVDPAIWGVTDIYLWAWYFDTNLNPVGDSPTNGTWTNSNEAQKFINNGNGTFSYTFIPSTLFGDTDIGRIGVLAKAKDGTGDKKTQDHLIDVGTFQVTINNPSQANTIVNSGTNLAVNATASNTANFKLFANGTQVATQNNTTTFSSNQVINQDTFFELEATSTSSGEVVVKTFNVILTPNPQILPVPLGMHDGINFDPNNSSTVTLVLFAPNKNFVHLIGNFHSNDWRLTNTYLLNKDTAQSRFWITLNNLSQGNQNLLYQYVVDANIRIADPYATTILDEFNDVFINVTTFPNLPPYPQGKTNHAVTFFQLDEVPYIWQTTNFIRPAQEDLVIYELLIRDFINLHSYDALINKLNYLKNLGINTIELMPVNEFDGNISWGYNPAFHMALDKYYGTRNSFKNFVDECHARGIAVILDVVYNHATGQNPYYRMWNDCNGCYGGQATAQNPIFNVEDPNTTFQFFNDINHEAAATKDYIDRLNTYWMEEYKVDGYRFDFTKGFTNVVGDGGGFDASRIAILTRMYNEIRAVDQTAYVILEHFAPNSEETQLINHRATTDPNEPGMLVWSNHNFNYNQATMGYDNSDFSWISYLNRGWSTPSSVGYMESHDEERLMFKNLAFGNSNGSYNITDFPTAIDRQKAAGAFYFTIPGPKMIWQFGELGYEFSINRCEDGTISNDCRTSPKPIAFDLGYLNNTERLELYHLWRRLLELKREEPIFQTPNFTLEVAADVQKKIYLIDNNATGNEIKYVIVVGNFGVSSITTQPFFQETGTWYDMIDNTPFEVTNTNMTFTLLPGQFRIFANEVSVLNVEEPSIQKITLYPNPATNKIQFSVPLETIQIYDVSGKLIKQFSSYSTSEYVSIEELKNGLYFLKVQHHGNIQTIKLLKK